MKCEHCGSRMAPADFKRHCSYACSAMDSALEFALKALHSAEEPRLEVLRGEWAFLVEAADAVAEYRREVAKRHRRIRNKSKKVKKNAA